MAETKNIAEMAKLLSDELFAEFLWQKTGPTDQNWPCNAQDVHKLKTHPSDVVFFYDNPYSLSRTYVNCDLKSYGTGTITKAKITPAIESLAKAVSCAETSQEWQKLYIHDTVTPDICGLLFVYNHDGGYDKDFRVLLNDANPTVAYLPKASKLVVLGPEDIFWLNNVRYEIGQMRGKGLIPALEHCRYFYPNLVRKNNIQPEHARAATLEMLTGPWIVLSFANPSNNRNGYVIFYRRKGESVPEFLYFIDYLMSNQLLQANTDVFIRTLQPDANAPIMFNKAVQEYIEECDNSKDISELLKTITYSQMKDIVTSFSDIEIGLDNA
jgi:hypothetical protein